MSQYGSTSDCEGPQPELGVEVPTACGGSVFYRPGAPCINFHGEHIYFCLSVCKEDYERDPHSSCMAARLFAAGE
jgi:hypothetical protein